MEELEGAVELLTSAAENAKSFLATLPLDSNPELEGLQLVREAHEAQSLSVIAENVLVLAKDLLEIKELVQGMRANP